MVRIIIFITLLSLGTSSTNAQKLFEINPYSGLAMPQGKFAGLSETGYNYGIATDVFLTRNFSLGFDLNYQFNDFKSFYDYSRIPPSGLVSYSVSILEKGEWNAFSFGFGPTYRIGTNSFSVSIYSKAGATVLSGPNSSVKFNFLRQDRELFEMKETKSMAFSVTSGVRLKAGLSSNIAFFVNPQIVYASNAIEYLHRDIDKAFIEDRITGVSYFDPGTIFELPPIKEKTNPIYFNINVGITISFGQVKPIQVPSSYISENSTKEKEEEEEEEEEEDICNNLSVRIKKQLQEDRLYHRVTIANKPFVQKGSAEPNRFSMEFEDIVLSDVKGEDSRNWDRNPQKISNKSKSLDYQYKKGNIPNGDFQLVDLVFEDNRKINGRVFCTWYDESSIVLCRDTVELKENIITEYFELKDSYSENYIIHRDTMLNVQYFNSNAHTSLVDYTMIDFEKQEQIPAKRLGSKSNYSMHGLNRLQINLNDYQLTPGKIYLLAVSDMMVHYYLKFKIPQRNEK